MPSLIIKFLMQIQIHLKLEIQRVLVRQQVHLQILSLTILVIQKLIKIQKLQRAKRVILGVSSSRYGKAFRIEMLFLYK